MILLASITINSAAQLLWLKFSPLILAFVIALCEALSRKTDRRWLHRFLVPLLSVIALVASCWVVWSNDKSARESKAGENAHLDRIEGRLGDEEATKRYLEGVNALTRQLTAAKTGNAVEKFFSSEAERHKQRDEVNKANQKLLRAYEIRMTAVRDYVLSKFDTWIAEIQKRNIRVDVVSKESPSVVIGLRKYSAAREATFESGDKAELQCHSAKIQDGQLTEVLMLRVLFNSANGSAADGVAFSTQINEKDYVINKANTLFTYEEYTGKSDNPINDSKFTALLDEALDQAMAFVVEEATLPR